MQKTGTRSSKNKKKMDTDEVIVKVEMDDIKLESLDDNNSCDLGMDGYFSYLNLGQTMPTELPKLILKSPAFVDPMYFSWPFEMDTEIIDVIQCVCEYMPQIKAAFDHIDLDKVDKTCYESMHDVCETYNKAIDVIAELEKGTSFTEQRLNKFASRELLRRILDLIYGIAVKKPHDLNKYPSFSPEVYGETSYNVVCQLIDHINISADDVFVDLGSGVGQVVLQMAGSVQLKTCYGIERADVPSTYAIEMDQTFRRLMTWFGKRWNDYKLIKGDFLADEHRDKISSATIVFVNNYAFGSTVDHELKERFAALPNGAKIFSSNNFCPLNFRINERNLNDIGAIMNVKRMPSLPESVSWAHKPVSYYLHTIDNTKLERYYERKKNGCGNGKSQGSRNARSDISTVVLQGMNENINGIDTSDSTNGHRYPRMCSGNACYKDSQSDEETHLKELREDVKKRTKLSKSTATTTGLIAPITSNMIVPTKSSLIVQTTSNLIIRSNNMLTTTPHETTPVIKNGKVSKLLTRRIVTPYPSSSKRLMAKQTCPNPYALGMKNHSNGSVKNVVEPGGRPEWMTSFEQSIQENLKSALESTFNCNARSFEEILQLQQQLHEANEKIRVLEEQRELVNEQSRNQQQKIVQLEHENAILSEKNGKTTCLECQSTMDMLAFCNNACHQKHLAKYLGQTKQHDNGI